MCIRDSLWTVKTPLNLRRRPRLGREDSKLKNFNFAAMFIVYSHKQSHPLPLSWYLNSVNSPSRIKCVKQHQFCLGGGMHSASILVSSAVCYILTVINAELCLCWLQQMKKLSRQRMLVKWKTTISPCGSQSSVPLALICWIASRSTNHSLSHCSS